MVGAIAGVVGAVASVVRAVADEDVVNANWIYASSVVVVVKLLTPVVHVNGCGVEDDDHLACLGSCTHTPT
jgi:ABC-type xylose transport system permease subunit